MERPYLWMGTMEPRRPCASSSCSRVSRAGSSTTTRPLGSRDHFARACRSTTTSGVGAVLGPLTCSPLPRAGPRRNPRARDPLPRREQDRRLGAERFSEPELVRHDVPDLVDRERHGLDVTVARDEERPHGAMTIVLEVVAPAERHDVAPALLANRVLVLSAVDLREAGISTRRRDRVPDTREGLLGRASMGRPFTRTSRWSA